MRAPVLFSLISAIALSACAGTGSSTNVDAYNSKITSHSNPLISELNASTAVQLAAAPPEGVATMTGTFLLQTPAGMTGVDKIAGQIDMSADFAAETVTGTMYQFIETYTDNTATSINGSANYSGTIDFDTTSGSTITATGSGNLTTSNNQSYSLSPNLNGEFYRRPGGDLASNGTLSSAATGGSLTHGLVGNYYVVE